jgi:hypothetical protein
MAIILRWVKFTEALNAAGVSTGTGRGFWGGVTSDGDIVVTSWLKDRNEDGTERFIHKPFTNHGGLRRSWDIGALTIGTKVKVILTDPGNSEGTGDKKKGVKWAAVVPGYWRVTKFGEFDGHSTAFIEPVANV